jgi:hypothetical protein
MAAFDEGRAPGLLLRLADIVVAALTAPARWVHFALVPGPLRDALEWPLFAANSLLWGSAGALVYARLRSSRR